MSATETVQSSSPTFQELPLTALRESKWNPRRHYDPAKLEELAASIRSKGVIEPIVARPLNGASGPHEIVAGSRRFRASKLARRETIPTIVRELSDVDALELAVVENQQRDDIHPLDEAEGYQALLKADRHYTPAIVAAKVGKSESYLYRRLKLLSLIPDVQQALEADRLTVAHAERLSRLNPALQKEAFHPERGVVYRLSPLRFDDGKQPPGLADLAPLHDLDEFIRERMAFKPRDEATQHFLPDVAEAIADSDETAPTASLLELSDDIFVRVKLRKPASDKAIPLNRNKWTEVKSEKACPHVQRGVVTHGGPPRVLLVCATKGCPKHFPVAKKAKRARTAAGEKAPSRPQWQIDQEKREAARKVWKALWAHVAPAVATHTAGAKFSAALVRTALQRRYNLDDPAYVERTYGVALTDKTAAQVLLLASVDDGSREDFLRSAKSIDFNLGTIEQRLKAKQKASDKAAPKTAKAKSAKKAKRFVTSTVPRRLTKVWGDTVRRDQCRAASCRKPIWFAVNVRTGNAMPFDGQPTAILIEREVETGREMWTVDLALAHFGTCPARAQFRRRR